MGNVDSVLPFLLSTLIDIILISFGIGILFSMIMWFHLKRKQTKD